MSCYSPEPLESIQKLYPFIPLIQPSLLVRSIESVTFPIQSSTFDWAISSAVIEPVDSLKNQIDVIAKSARVANGLFHTTPNRYH